MAVALVGLVIAHLLQDYLTLRGTTATTVVRQTESDWLTLEGVRDMTAWIHVSQANTEAAFRIDLETSPTADENLFQAVTQTSVGTGGVFVAVSRARQVTGALVPLARFLRWSVVTQTPSANWALTFRVFVCLNPTTSEHRITRGSEAFESPTQMAQMLAAMRAPGA